MGSLESFEGEEEDEPLRLWNLERILEMKPDIVECVRETKARVG